MDEVASVGKCWIVIGCKKRKKTVLVILAHNGLNLEWTETSKWDADDGHGSLSHCKIKCVKNFNYGSVTIIMYYWKSLGWNINKEVCRVPLLLSLNYKA